MFQACFCNLYSYFFQLEKNYMNELEILHLMSQNSDPLKSNCGNVGECPLCLKKYLHASE